MVLVILNIGCRSIDTEHPRLKNEQCLLGNPNRKDRKKVVNALTSKLKWVKIYRRKMQSEKKNVLFQKLKQKISKIVEHYSKREVKEIRQKERKERERERK